jgi:hypothetical protein
VLRASDISVDAGVSIVERVLLGAADEIRNGHPEVALDALAWLASPV